MPISKANAANRLWINHKSVDYLISQQRLQVVPSPTSNRDLVTVDSLFNEIGERYRRFGTAIANQAGSGNCACGCGSTTSPGKDFLAGHDQALQGIVKFFLLSGSHLEVSEAIALANRYNINIQQLITRGY